ncbi:MAG TPA: DUF2656 domain-containing protein [Pseudanabaena sp.]|nr:DUF2656 domain-containing protein [Pseudanabaena sp.]
MLLSHNFNVSPEMIPPLSREEFAEVFRLGLRDRPSYQTRLVNHPHWIVEILFDHQQFSPNQIGEFCAEALANKRIGQGIATQSLPDILVLGGIKTTPPTSNSPDALQTSDWGVDVVETISADSFLQDISWETTVASKPIEEIFKVAYRN